MTYSPEILSLLILSAFYIGLAMGIVGGYAVGRREGRKYGTGRSR